MKTDNINKYQDDYKRKNYDRLTLLMAKGTKKKLQNIAAERGISVNAIINQLIAAFLSANRSAPADPAGTDGDGDSPGQSQEDSPEE